MKMVKLSVSQCSLYNKNIISSDMNEGADHVVRSFLYLQKMEKETVRSALFYIPKHLPNIQTRTTLTEALRISRCPITDACGNYFFNRQKKIFLGLILCCGQRIRRSTFFIQTTFVTNANGTSVEPSTVGAYLISLCNCFQIDFN